MIFEKHLLSVSEELLKCLVINLKNSWRVFNDKLLLDSCCRGFCPARFGVLFSSLENYWRTEEWSTGETTGYTPHTTGLCSQWVSVFLLDVCRGCIEVASATGCNLVMVLYQCRKCRFMFGLTSVFMHLHAADHHSRQDIILFLSYSIVTSNISKSVGVMR